MIALKFTTYTVDKYKQNNGDDASGKYFPGDVFEFTKERAAELLKENVAVEATPDEIAAYKSKALPSAPQNKAEKKFD